MGGAMSTPAPGSSPGGRANQKMRTRRELLHAAQRLLDGGRPPTVAEAADEAQVSRATAYRYFPSQEALLSEAALLPELPWAVDLFDAPDAPTDPEERVQLVHDVLFDHIRAREAEFRLFQRNRVLQALEQGPSDGALRPAFRVGMLDVALAPVADELGDDRLGSLKNALGVLIGTEAVIAARDVLQLDHDTARAQLGHACRLLVRAYRAEAKDARTPSS